MSKISGYGQDTAPTSDDYTIQVDGTTSTNKRVTWASLRSIFSSKRVTSITSSATPTPNGDTTDVYTFYLQNGAATIGAPTGTPTDAQVITLRIRDNGTAAALTWNAIWVGIGVTLPTTTTANKWIYLTAMYNGFDSTWHVIGIRRQT
jgi:hypothetical protein